MQILNENDNFLSKIIINYVSKVINSYYTQPK